MAARENSAPNRKVLIAWPGITNMARKIDGKWFCIGQNTPLVEPPIWWGEIPLTPQADDVAAER